MQISCFLLKIGSFFAFLEIFAVYLPSGAAVKAQLAGKLDRIRVGG